MISRTHRVRDAGAAMHHRFFEFREADVANGIVTLTASTDAPVSFGSYREILDHHSSNVDYSACRALLINHDANQIAGAILDIKFDGHRSTIRAQINRDAKLQSGVRVVDAVKDGSLRGVSIGYNYDPEQDTSYDEATRTVTVRKWRLMEATLTPIPRDTDSMVRSFDSIHQRHAAASQRNHNEQEKTMDPIKLAALYTAHPKSIEFISQRIAAGEKDITALEAAVKAHESQGDERERAQKIADDRAALTRELEIVTIAESHGLRAADYRKMPSISDAVTKMLADKAEAEKKARGAQGAGAPLDITFVADASDKRRDAVVDAMLSRSELVVRKEGLSGSRAYQDAEKDLGMRGGFSFHTFVKECAMASGERDAWRWSGEQIARWVKAAPRLPGTASMMASERAANQAFGQFPGILANYMDKAVALGFQGYEAITYNQWTKPRPVNDFKPFINTALTMGNLAQATENVGFSELTAKDLSYTNSLAMWGGTLTLTYQALVSDDLGEFMRNLGMAGTIAQRTIDRQVYVALINGPGANSYASNTGWGLAALAGVDTITSAPLGTQDNLDLVRNAFRKKISPAGQFMGNTPRWLIHPIPLARKADQAVGNATPPGEQSYLASNRARQIQTLEVNFLDDPSITGSSASNYYLAGDSSVDTLVVATLATMQVPQVTEFDPGATADRKFKVMMPFVAFIPTYTDGTSIQTPTSANIANRPIGLTRGGP